MPAQSAWGQAFKWSLGNWRISILLLVPAAVVLKTLHQYPLAIFGASALALIPLASLLGDATEELAGHVGPALGGFLNARSATPPSSSSPSWPSSRDTSPSSRLPSPGALSGTSCWFSASRSCSAG